MADNAAQAAAAVNGKPKPTDGRVQFKSGPQVFLGLGAGFFSSGQGKSRVGSQRMRSDEEFKCMLRHPTIRLATDIVKALLMRIPWTVDGENEQICEYVYSQIEPFKTYIIRSAVKGILKDGWRAFELVYGLGEHEALGLRQTLDGVKALRSQNTSPMVWDDTGDFAGVETNGPRGSTVFIDADHTVLINADDEGFGDLAEPLLRVAQESHRKWELCDKGAQRYDDKVAGGFLAIGYPVGETEVTDGTTVSKIDNGELAARFGASIKAGGFGTYPRQADPETGEYNKDDWKFDIIASGQGAQPAFVTREKYLDAMMMRAMGLPERAATEGTFGTKAEAEAHADIAITVNTERAEYVVEGINVGFTEPFNESNFGDPGVCKLCLGELDPDSRALFSQIFTSLMADPVFADQAAGRVDVAQVMDKLKIPTVQQQVYAEGPTDA